MNITFSIQDILENGTAEIIGSREINLEKKLQIPGSLKVKFGTDPTSPNIHVGRSIPLWKMRALQELGHEIHIIVGDFTGQIGDTSDKDSERPMISAEKIEENMRSYIEQIWMILNPEKKELVHIHYNSEWLSKLTFKEVSIMADVFSVNSFIKRELISKRLESGSRVSLREMLYPLMQGYDSLALGADVELGGTDQRFNLLAGRALQESKGLPQQAVIMNTLISGTDGRKMSSSFGNVIALLDTPEDKFGKVMRVRDDLVSEYLLIFPLSVQPFTEVAYKEAVQKGENPRDYKLKLAWTLVALYHGEEVADKIQNAFIQQFSEGQVPEDMPEFKIEDKEISVVDLLIETNLMPTKSEAKRLIEQGGVRLDGRVVADYKETIITSAVQVINVGKRKYLRLKV